MRVTNAPARKARHKKLFKSVKGFKWGRKNVYRLAINAAVKAGQNSYIGRKQKKRDFRRLWIVRITAGLQAMGKRYSEFIFKMTEKKIIVNRKSLADLAATQPKVFEDFVNQVYA